MAERAEPEPEATSLARSAMTSYRAALTAGDAEAALRWVDRAHRLVPRDPNIMLALAGASLSREPARAAHLFATVTEQRDVREAWLGLCASRLRLGSADQARMALVRALSRHTPRNDTRAVANETIRATGDHGWCALTYGGRLVLHTIVSETPVIALDGDILPSPDPGGAHAPGYHLPAHWVEASRLTVMIEGRHLLGSPIDITAIRRTEGIVAAEHGALRGWAWHPADPGRPVLLRVSDDEGFVINIRADDASVLIPNLGPLAHPLGFHVPADTVNRLGTTLRVETHDNQTLYGSPLAPLGELRGAMTVARDLATHYPALAESNDPGAAMIPMQAGLPLPARAEGRSKRARSAAVVIPVHGQRDLTLGCLDSVLDTVTAPDRIIVVDDASPDPVLRDALDDLARLRRITLLRNPRSLGFAASVNRGLRASRGRDVVLLNSDTLVPPEWLERLRDAAHADRDIGTVTPLSNDASILSYPDPAARNPAPDRLGTRRLDSLARSANGTGSVDIPVGVGFCLYIRRDCLNAVGVLRDDIFAQGYGEENDFCLRARRLGWRHVALPSLFVAHLGGQSFNQAGAHLRERNGSLLERLHPGYNALVQDFLRDDPLAPFRRRLDQRRWRGQRDRRRDSVILVTHDASGGVEQRIRRAVADHQEQGRTSILLRPATLADGAPAVEISLGTERFPNLRYRMPEEMPALIRWLRRQRPVRAELHHFLGHHGALRNLSAALGVPYDVHIHDYGWFCPRVALVDGHGRYCGEPDLPGCEACVTDHGRLDEDDTPVAMLREQSAIVLRGAARVIAPSADTANRIARHFPGLRPVVVPHQDDASIPHRLPRATNAGRRRRVCVLGGIGVHKGYHVLLACARDAAQRDLDLEFIIVGTTIGDARLLETGRAFVTGSYEAAQAVELVIRQDADLGFLPSIAPETWCMSLTELWRAGLTVAAFDIGAPAERIRNTRRGFLLPPHLPPGAINNALVNAMASSDPRAAPASSRSIPSPDPSHIVAKGP